MRAPALLLALAISVPASAQDLARELLDGFHAVSWNSVAPPPRSFEPAWLDNGGLACFHHRQVSGEVEWNTDYYALDPAAPACRLLGFRVSTPDLNPQDATKIYDATRAVLERELGASHVPVDRFLGGGAGYWAATRQWDRDGLRILLFVNDGPCTPERKSRCIEILAENQDMLRARTAAFAVNSSSRGRNLRAEMEPALLAEVGDLLPKLNTPRANLEALLSLISQSAGERRAALLLAADEVADSLGRTFVVEPNAPLGTLRTETSANLRFELDHYGGWTYKHDLLERVWQQYEGSRWGEAAFVLLQENGWYFGKSCPADSVFFPKVIEHGERFLKDHPNSPQRMETIFQLAQAYEDWWNSSLAPSDGMYSQMPRTRMEEMRQKAVVAYDQVIAAEPQSVRGRWAALRVPRLKLGLHTDRFRFVDDCD